jgi:hypothetical protein
MKLGLILLLLLSTLSAFAQAVATLANVRKVYVEKMENGLDQYLRSEISRQFRGNLTVVLERSGADAVLKGVNLGAQNTTRSTVQLVDPSGRVVLWSGSAGDRNGKWLDLKHGGQQKVAAHLIGQLRKAMQPR